MYNHFGENSQENQGGEFLYWKIRKISKKTASIYIMHEYKAGRTRSDFSCLICVN